MMTLLMANPRLKKDKDGSGWYTDEKGVSFETLADYYQFEVFGFCGCGRPKANLVFIRDGIRLIDDRQTAMKKGTFIWAEEEQKAIALFGNGLSMNFFFYWCDNLELTEHGGAIPGWLTDRGEMVLKDLETIIATEFETLEVEG